MAVVVDAARKIDDMTLSIVNRLTRDRSHINASEILLVLNKVRPHDNTTTHDATRCDMTRHESVADELSSQMDLVEPRERVLPKVDEYNRDNIFNEIFFVSALKGSGLDELKVRNFFFIESPSPIVRRARSPSVFVHPNQNYLISKAAPGDLPYPADWVRIARESCAVCGLGIC